MLAREIFDALEQDNQLRAAQLLAQYIVDPLASGGLSIHPNITPMTPTDRAQHVIDAMLDFNDKMVDEALAE